MTTILVAGYKSFDLGIFQDKDPRLRIIKKAIKRDLVSLLDSGLEWLIFMGNLGFEHWVLQVAQELQVDYDLQLATIFPFANHGENWNQTNQSKLADFKGTDFVKYSFEAYENPSQFKLYNQFVLDNSDGAYIFYDSENETNFKYLYQMMQDQDDYQLRHLTFEDLNTIMQEEEWD